MPTKLVSSSNPILTQPWTYPGAVVPPVVVPGAECRVRQASKFPTQKEGEANKI